MRTRTSAKEKFLDVLGQIARKHKNSFSQVFSQYISQDKNQLRDPISIPNTSYWAENNISTPQKAIVLFKILDKFSYSDSDIVQYLKYITYND